MRKEKKQFPVLAAGLALVFIGLVVSLFFWMGSRPELAFSLAARAFEKRTGLLVSAKDITLSRQGGLNFVLAGKSLEATEIGRASCRERV